jgi:monofunctional biosynthetic peptidoglycan transglycosylase
MRKNKKTVRVKFKVIKFILQCLLLCTVISIIIILPFRWLNPPITSFQVFDAFKNPENPLQVVSGTWVNEHNLPANMKMAVIAAEDQHFAEHHGLDLGAIWKAYQHNLHNKRIKGGSTLTQQLAKNLYLWPHRSYLRKAMEAWLSLWLEILWPKTRILEVYLNVVEYGPHIFGVDAAAKNFFHRSARHLSKQQCALLAAVLPSPKRFKVQQPSAYLQQKQLWILKQMQQLGGISYLHKLR